MRGLNLDHLRMFAQVAELGSFSAAAERNGVTQPAVSLQVRQLERRYGLKLVERVGRRAVRRRPGWSCSRISAPSTRRWPRPSRP